MTTYRTIARFPVYNPDGSLDTTFVAARQDGVSYTWEENTTNDLVSPRFRWSSPRLAMSVAMSNAGWGHLNTHYFNKAQQETAARREAAERVNGVTVPLHGAEGPVAL